MATSRTRLDILLVQRKLVPSRQRAQALIMAGKVLVDDRPASKPGQQVDDGADVRLRQPDHPYVGRGGLKLAGALADLGLDVNGWRCLDVGASTGGFCDCLLQRGAATVVAVDVGTNQLDWKLRSDPRVEVHEQTDIRELADARRGAEPATGGPVDLAVIDVSFISLRLVLPPTVREVRPGGWILALVKPQFEVGRGQVGKGGVVRDPALRQGAIDGIRIFASELGLTWVDSADSRVRGAKKGNVEHFLLFRASDSPTSS